MQAALEASVTDLVPAGQVAGDHLTAHREVENGQQAGIGAAGHQHAQRTNEAHASVDIGGMGV